jgi:hypothetical protein
MPSPSEGGHGHVGWHIWLVCILEFKIFGCHSIVFALQKGFVKFQMTLPELFKLFIKNEEDMKFESKGI